MIAGMTTSDVMASDIRTQADAIVAANPPFRVLDNIVVGLSIALGWTAGHAARWMWKYPVSYVVILGLSIRHGYRISNPRKPAPPAPQPDPNHPESQKMIYGAGSAVGYRDPRG